MIAAVREKRRGVVVESVVIVEKNVVRRLGKEESMKNFSGKEGKGREGKGREGKESTSFMVGRVHVEEEEEEEEVRSSVAGTSGLTFTLELFCRDSFRVESCLSCFGTGADA
jgi:hypothetical protein